MKKWYVAVLLGTSLGTLAADGASMKDSSSKGSPAPALKRELALMERFDNQNVNLGVRADLLYMVYNAPVLSYGSKVTTDDTTHIENSKIQNVRGKMSVGCNLALMYTMHDNPGYSFETSWYHIVAQFKNNFSSTEAEVLPGHTDDLDTPQPGKASVYGHQNINLFDLVIKKDFSFGDWVGFTPVAGLVGGYMNGVSTSNYSATSGSFQSTGDTPVRNASLNYHTKFEGIGVKFGMNSKFKIGCGFRLDANIAYNVMYGLARSTLNYLQDAVDTDTPALLGDTGSYSNHHARSFVDALLGLGWESHFGHNRYFFDLHAGWRYQSFFGGWTTFETDLSKNVNELNYAGQGLEVGATFRF